MAVTQSNRFFLNKDETIDDDLTGKKYATMEEAYIALIELNNYVVDFEEEITRQSNEIDVLIEDLAGENI